MEHMEGMPATLSEKHGEIPGGGGRWTYLGAEIPIVSSIFFFF